MAISSSSVLGFDSGGLQIDPAWQVFLDEQASIGEFPDSPLSGTITPASVSLAVTNTYTPAAPTISTADLDAWLGQPASNSLFLPPEQQAFDRLPSGTPGLPFLIDEPVRQGLVQEIQDPFGNQGFLNLSALLDSQSQADQFFADQNEQAGFTRLAQQERATLGPNLNPAEQIISERGQPGFQPELGSNFLESLGELAGIIGDVPLNPLAPDEHRTTVGDVLGADIPESVRRPIIDAAGVAGEVAELSPFARPFFELTGLDGGETAEAVADLVVPREAWELAIELVPGIGALPGTLSFVARSRIGQLVAREGLENLTREAVEKIAREVSEAAPDVLAREARAVLGRQNADDLARVLSRGQVENLGAGLPGDPGDVDDVARQILGDGTDVGPTAAREGVVSSSPAPSAPPRPPEEVPDPVNRLTQIINDSRILPGETAEVRSAALRQRVAAGARILDQSGRTPDGYRRATAALSGELPRARIDAPVGQFSPDEVTGLRAKLTEANLQFFEELNAEQALNKVMDGRLSDIAPFELNLLDRVFGPELAEAIARKQPIDWWEEAAGIISAPQTLMASGDLSAPLRQGFVIGAAHPTEWMQAWRPMVKAGLSEDVARQLDEGLRRLDWVSGHVNPDKADLAFTRVGGHISELGRYANEGEREAGRAFMGRSRTTNFIRDKIPFVRPSERAYVTNLNYMRGKVYAVEAEKMWRAGVRDPEQYRALAAVINHASGWSEISFGQIRAGRTGINAFFAPRLWASRIQVALDPIVQPGSLLKPSARQLAAKHLIAATTVPAAMITATAMATGAALTWNPIDTDFGKLVFGKQRIDLLGGFSPLVRFVARMVQGEGISSSGNRFSLDSAEDRLGLVADLVRSKESPFVGLLTDLFTGEDFVGDPVKLDAPGIRDLILENITPFFVQDVWEAAKLEGVEGGFRSAPGFFGGSVLTYETVGELRDAEAQEKFGTDYDQLLPRQAFQVDEQLRAEGKLERGEISTEWEEGEQERQARQDAAETAFINPDTPLTRSLPDIWSDLNKERYGARSQLAVHFKEVLSELSRDEFDRLIDSYYDLDATNPDGTTNFDQLGRLQEDFLNGLSQEKKADGSPSDFEYMMDYLALVQEKKSPFEREWRSITNTLEANGYFNISVEDQDTRNAFWQAYPELEAQYDFWRRYDEDNTASLQSETALDVYLLLNEQYGTDWKVKVAPYGIVINESPENEAAYRALAPRVQAYFDVESEQRTSYLRDNPSINAALVLLGYSTLKLQTIEAQRQLEALNDLYGTDVTGELAKNAK